MRKLLVIVAVSMMLPVMGAAQLESVPSAATGHGDTVSEVAEQPVVEEDGELDNRVAPEANDHGEEVREAAKKKKKTKKKRVADLDGDNTPIIKGSGNAMVDRHGPMKTGRFEVVALKGGTVANTILAGVKGSGQHDEFDTEEKMTERTVEDVDWRIDGETVSLTWATEDGDEGTYDLVVITDDEGAKLPGWRESDLPTTNTEVVNYREGNMKEYDLIITVPGRTVEQDSYREGDDAEYSKKTWGQPSFDDLEMERGVKPGDTKMHDWFEDVRAGSADSATKEISVRMQNEEGGGKIDIAFIHADGSVSSYRLDVDGDSEPSEDESNGGDPQTGKEIKIPANLKGGTVSNTILAGIIDKEEVERGKVVAVAAIKNAGNGPRCKIPVGLKDEEHQRPSAGDGPACDVPIG